MTKKTIQTSEVQQAREVLIAKVHQAKASVETMMAVGDRDFGALKRAVDLYIDYLTAADALGYHTEITE